MRSMWKGAISFGLVMIPVKLYTATEPQDIAFRQVHREDGGRIRYKRVCSVDGEEVPYEEIVKGYEIEPGRYVTITPAELEALEAERTRRIEIEEFVALDDIDPIHWESTYYLAPDRTAGKPYALLLAALESTSRVRLGRVVLRSKEYLAAIRPAQDALMLSTMLFADEIVPRAAVEELADEPAEVSPKELAIASQLVESLAAEWDPERYKDTYRERVIDLVRAKAEGREIVESHVPEPAAKVDDLMAALEASLAAATSQATARKPTAKKAGTKPRRAAAPKKA
jgi:DNA end-binding protein Ku